MCQCVSLLVTLMSRYGIPLVTKKARVNQDVSCANLYVLNIEVCS